MDAVSALAERLGLDAPPFAHGCVVRRDEPLARHTSMRVGGPADLFCEVESEDALAGLLSWVSERGVPVFLLGGGTNLVVADAGIRGLTVKLGRSFARTEWGDERDGVVRVVAGAAANFKRLVLEVIERGYGGLEFGEGIPGTVGGGVLMNAGAFGGEIANVVEALRGVSGAGERRRLVRDELPFAYRKLDLPPGFVVTALEMRLTRGEPAAIAARVADAKRKRGRRQPLGLPNAGSVFKNPPGDFAGRLIELCGLKGRAIGGAQVSPQHANFIVNTGNARAADVRALMDEIRDTVWQRCGVRLEPEVRLVGEW
ncbi:MAG: UDP-N-acetylmuramate dehydrogenase [Thermodesulfobacteriota bacterium]